MSLEGHTEAVWCVKMMADQGLMLTGFSLSFSVSKDIAVRYCKMHKLKLVEKCSHEIFNDALFSTRTRSVRCNPVSGTKYQELSTKFVLFYFF